MGDVEYGLLRRVSLKDFAGALKNATSDELYKRADQQKRIAEQAAERAEMLRRFGDMVLEAELKESAEQTKDSR